MPAHDDKLASSLQAIAGNPHDDGPWLELAACLQEAGDEMQAAAIRASLPQLRAAVEGGQQPADALSALKKPRAFTTEIVTNSTGEQKKDDSVHGWHILATVLGFGIALVPVCNKWGEDQKERDEQAQQMQKRFQADFQKRINEDLRNGKLGPAMQRLLGIEDRRPFRAPPQEWTSDELIELSLRRVGDRAPVESFTFHADGAVEVVTDTEGLILNWQNQGEDGLFILSPQRGAVYRLIKWRVDGTMYVVGVAGVDEMYEAHRP